MLIFLPPISDTLLLMNVLFLDPLCVTNGYWVLERLTQPIPGVWHVGELCSCRWFMRFSVYHYQTFDQVHKPIPQTVLMTSNYLTRTGINKANVLLLWITLVSATFQWQKSAALPQKQYQQLAQLNALYSVFHQSIFDPYNAWFYWGSFDKISQ